MRTDRSWTREISSRLPVLIPGMSGFRVKEAFDRHGKVLTRGISPVKGLFYAGLPWQTHRGSALLAGVGRDAREMVKRDHRKRG